jgi:glycosyltransferase involved in cell wall biosynthesis
MRVLLVAHNYPPAHTAGVEQHTAQVARELLRRGCDVSVFCAEKDVSRAPGALVEREHDGVRVTEFTNNLTYSAFGETWDFREAELALERHLARVKPDVVHFQHLMYLSVGCLDAVARAGAACVFTLHDYWLHCARFGQRLHPDGTVCATIDFARCGACMAGFKFRQSALERSTGRWIAGVKQTLGLDVAQVAKRTARRLGLTPPQDVAPAPEQAAAMARELAARDRELRTRVLGGVQRLIAPSRFLLERMVEWGVPRDALELMRMGAEVDRFAAHPRQRAAGSGSGPLRVVFLGTFAPHKAPHLIVEAWRSLPSELRATATLELFGSGAHYPDYVDALRRAADEAGASVRPVLSRDGVASTLTSADLLVMPSVWWENAPLVLIEAVEARTPILVSDLGGMAEFVSERPCGAAFAPGDSADLARKLSELLGDRRRLAQFYSSGPRPPTMADNVARMEQIYAEVVGERRAAR